MVLLLFEIANQSPFPLTPGALLAYSNPLMPIFPELMVG